MRNDDSIKIRGELTCVLYDTHQVTHKVKTRWAHYIRTQTNNINKTWLSYKQEGLKTIRTFLRK